jgi:hypothetical protein
MPTCHSKVHHRRRRRTVGLLAALVATTALALPGSASAAEEGFCGYVTIPSGWQCRATNRHWLYSVEGYVNTAGSNRICAASATTNAGAQNSNWACGYQYTQTLLGGNVYGVGAIHNGAPWTWQLWVAVQTWF